jgi:competence protein ComEC
MKALQFPLIRITLFFVLGILFAFHTEPTLFWTVLLSTISFLVFGICYFFSTKNDFNKLYFGVSAFLLSFCIGVTTQTIHTSIFRENHYMNHIGLVDKEHSIEITLKEKLKNTAFNSRFVANVNRFDNKKSCGKIILNIRKDSLDPIFEIGSVLKIKGSIYKNREINNPNQFDYGKYLENQQIYAQVYADVNDIQINPIIDKDIWYYTSKFRSKIIRNLERKHFHNKELSVIVALILGQQQDISPEIIQDYQYAGAVHILSVSGLHVGFIMLFIGFILKPIPNTKMGSFTKLVIVIIALWLFGFVAGLAPSILRSVVMFSFVAIGKYLRRSVNIYHTLLVSAMLILLFKPSFLFDVGFQLSYVSLFFIIWLQPLLSGIWIPKNISLKYFWDILTVSFAAQIGAFPLSIYYFHQFPGLFFITNLIILPFMGIILALGVVVMIMAFFDYVPIFTMKFLEYSVLYLDKIINWIASFEQFIIQNIPMNSFMLWSLYIMIVALIVWFKKPNFHKLIFALLAIILFQISCFGTKYFYQNQQELIVFNLKKSTIITERNGENATIFSNDSILKNTDSNKLLKSYLVGNFSRIENKKLLSNLLFFNHKKILVLDNLVVFPKNDSPDILIITNSPKLNLERFLENYHPKLIIADGSNFKTYVKVWKATCEKQKIPFHATAEKGFCRLK